MWVGARTACLLRWRDRAVGGHGVEAPVHEEGELLLRPPRRRRPGVEALPPAAAAQDVHVHGLTRSEGGVGDWVGV